MKTYRFYFLISALVLSILLLGACGPAETVELPANGECPPGYHPVYAPAGGWGGYCQLDSPLPETVDLPADGECPPGYHPVYAPAGGWGGYCQLNPPPPETVDMPADGECPPGYYPVYAPAGGWGSYCQLNHAPTESFHPLSIISTYTPPPPAQALNPVIPDLKPAMEIVQYCANNGANLGGVNISFQVDNTLHIEDWFSESPGHVKCVDDVSNPRTCWGPESATFEVLLCNGTLVQNKDSYACETLPVTLGACTQEREDPDQPACEHC